MISARACLLLSATLILAQSGRPPLAPAVQTSVSQPDPATQSKIVQSYGKLPLSFEANLGQTDAEAKFLSRSSGYALFLTENETVFDFHGSRAKADASRIGPRYRPNPFMPTNPAVLRMKLRDANPAANVTGADELPGKSNYLIGNDPSKWHSNIPTYAKVKYEEIYPGIDLVYYGTGNQLEYDFIVASGADPRRIQFDVHGAKRISRDRQGDLVLDLNEGEVRWHKPVVYQESDNARQEIAARYVIRGKNRVAFEVANYDSRKTLFIDPLIYSTYLGGSGGAGGDAIAVDSTGNAYVTGGTSTGFPTVNPLQPTIGGSTDAFVAKLNPTGSALVYSTYLGGSGADVGLGVAVDSAGNAYVTGETNSTDFPTATPLQAANGGGFDAFVAKINPSGSALVYSTYLGGSGNDSATGIAADSSGNAYITGGTGSNNFPTIKPLQPANGGGNGDAFVAKINPTGSALIYSTYLGDSGYDQGNGIAVHLGNAYVTGETDSTNFPTMNSLQPVYGGGSDAFVAVLNPTGSTLIYSTYLGGSTNDQGNSIAVDSSGNAYLTGFTNSNNFPTMKPLQGTCRGGYDAFAAKLNSSGSALVYSTYLGGSKDDYGNGITVDTSGAAYVTGHTASTNFRTVRPLQAAYGGGFTDAFVVKINPLESGFAYSTYLGGSGDDSGNSIAQHVGNTYVTGQTSSTNFPTMNPLQQANADTYSAFVTEISRPPQ